MAEDQFDNEAYQQKIQDLQRRHAVKQARKDFKKLRILNGPDKWSHEELIEEARKDLYYRQEMDLLLEADAHQKRILLKKEAEQQAKRDFAMAQKSAKERARLHAQELKDEIDKRKLIEQASGGENEMLIFSAVLAFIFFLGIYFVFRA